MIRNKIAASLAILSILTSLVATAAPLTVSGGKFTKDGQPFNGVGINYFNGFTRYAANGKDLSWKAGLATLNKYQIPFIRINTFGFWPADIQSQYLNNKEQFYARLDDFMNEAARQNIGVVLDLFFNLPAFPELNKESFGDLGNENSAARAMMRAMTLEIVSRYKNHPALWGWEFANETNPLVDLPANVNNSQWLPHRDPANTLPRSAKDNYNVNTILGPMTEFAANVRKIDTKTPIFSGNNVSRFDAYHLSQLNSWDPDTPEQFGAIVSRDNPAQVNTLTMHLYPESEGKLFGQKSSAYTDILAAVMARSKIDGKPFFLGEFGVSEKAQGTGASAKFGEITAAIMANHVPLSALWAFDLTQQDGTYNITATNSRAYQLDTIKSMNTTMKTWK